MCAYSELGILLMNYKFFGRLFTISKPTSFFLLMTGRLNSDSLKEISTQPLVVLESTAT